jgi:hypothetical protein
MSNPLIPTLTLNTRLLPFRDYDEHEVINLFSLNQTGVGGMLVTALVNTPSNDQGYSSTTPFGAPFNLTESLRYVVTSQVAPTSGGEGKLRTLGLTLYSTQEYDENGQILKYNPHRLTELSAVLSGQAVPVLKRGLVTLYNTAYIGTPVVGAVGVPYTGGNGLIQVVDPATLGYSGQPYKPSDVVGKFISSTGVEFGGYALFLLDL